MTVKQARLELDAYYPKSAMACPGEQWQQQWQRWTYPTYMELQLCLPFEPGFSYVPTSQGYARARNWYKSVLAAKVPRFIKSPDYSTPAEITKRCWEGASTHKWWLR